MIGPILRAATLRPVPWKNGGGVTTEYAVHPVGAGFDDFDWRISRANVASDGPFSRFPGIDRTLTVLSGAGIVLYFADRAVRLTPRDPPFTFPGDVAVTGTLIDGPIDDLNIMTRRGRWQHRIERLTAPTAVTCPIAVLFSLDTLAWGTGLGRFDAAFLPPGDQAPAGSAFLIQLAPQDRTDPGGSCSAGSHNAG